MKNDQQRMPDGQYRAALAIILLLIVIVLWLFAHA